MTAFSKKAARPADVSAPASKPVDELNLEALDAVAGGKVTYYQMNGNWYVVGHDKHGRSTGVTNMGPCG